ncbi:hypothetical protein [Gracilibacillus sp. YIM 98692]|uniref:hypothetical protein n=1 Tax=Gracilibacillus sp. YIM 98692 TaxID=2663532 RepID=UPI0013CF82D0|nr:hypothetical protein [Gracilibacillus sp. YIM 98692]
MSENKEGQMSTQLDKTNNPKAQDFLHMSLRRTEKAQKQLSKAAKTLEKTINKFPELEGIENVKELITNIQNTKMETIPELQKVIRELKEKN